MIQCQHGAVLLNLYLFFFNHDVFISFLLIWFICIYLSMWSGANCQRCSLEVCQSMIYSCFHSIYNKANLRDLIAATGLVILLKFDPNQWLFVLCDLEIWWMTLENNRAPFLYYIKLCASFQIHRWIQIGVTVRKRSIWVKIDNFLSRVTLKFDGWPWKPIGHLFYVASSFVHHFTAISEFKLELQSGNTQSGWNSTIFKAVPPWNLTDDLTKQ